MAERQQAAEERQRAERERLRAEMGRVYAEEERRKMARHVCVFSRRVATDADFLLQKRAERRPFFPTFQFQHV